MNVIIPLVQAKLNATFLLLHRFLRRWLNGRPLFHPSATPTQFDSPARPRKPVTIAPRQLSTGLTILARNREPNAICLLLTQTQPG
jgi:hypothetical protein